MNRTGEEKPARRPSLWHNRDFVVFWSGESASQFGNKITLLALPLTAVLTLSASPVEMGILNAASYLPFMLLSLFVGVWIDRSRKRPIMLVSALGRAVVLASIPVLAVLGLLSVAYLCVAALVIGVFTVLFEITYQAYFPVLVAREDLVEGNSKLQLSASTAEVGGPAIGGWLVSWLTAPIALVVDCATFLVSAVTVAAIRTREPEPVATGRERHIWREIGEGLRFTFGNRSMRACVLEAATYNMFWLALETVFLLYATGALGMGPGEIGFALGSGAVGSLLGSVVARRMSERLGIGTTVSVAMVVGCAAPILIPLAAGPRPVVFAVLALSFFIGGLGSTVANVQVVSLRQAITPAALLGRMNASYRLVAMGVIPVGALLGGVLGETIGLRATLFVAAAGMIAAALWIVFSPIRSITTLPDDEPAALQPDR